MFSLSVQSQTEEEANDRSAEGLFFHYAFEPLENGLIGIIQEKV